MRIVKFTPLLVIAMACGPAPQPRSITDADLPRWEVSPEPALHLGVVEGDPNLQFFRISGLARLGPDRIVVANAGTQELRYFNQNGEFLSQAGGRGEGPGEFKFLQTVNAISSDSLLAFEGTWRAAYFDSAGTFLGTFLLENQDGQTVPRGLWLYRHYLVDGIPVGRDVETTKGFLARLPPPIEEPWYWYVRFDSTGNMWVSDDIVPGGDRSDWTVIDSTGAAIARVSLPPRFEMFEATDRDVMGRWRDENEVEYVRVYALHKPAAGSVPLAAPILMDSGVTAAGVEVPQELLDEIRGSLRYIVTAQEMYFADHTTYTANRHDLEIEAPEGLLIDLISASGRGWFAIVTGPELPMICGIAVGADTPRGWSEGLPWCADVE